MLLGMIAAFMFGLEVEAASTVEPPVPVGVFWYV
jgi:hypothetical protein